MTYAIQSGFGPIATPPAPWDAPWGMLRGGRSVLSSNISTASTSLTDAGCSATVDVVGGRLYRCNVSWPAIYCSSFPGSTLAYGAVADEANVVIDYFFTWQLTAANGHTPASGFVTYEAPCSARKTFKLQWYTSAGTVAADAATQRIVLTVEDIGPADKVLRGIQ